MPQRFQEEEFKLLDKYEDEDDDASENEENDESDLWTDQEIPLFEVISHCKKSWNC